MLHHRGNKYPYTVPFASYYRGNPKTLVKAKDVTEALRNAMQSNVHRTVLKPRKLVQAPVRMGIPFCNIYSLVF
jgi:hypothetical protein